MSVSKAQKARVLTTCQCGCGEEFSAFPTYRPKSEGGGLRVPEYKRGHHPNCRKHQTSEKEPWNKGLRKGDHPSIDRMGFQYGHAFGRYPNGVASEPRMEKRRFRSRSTAAYQGFQKSILDRDQHTCQDCGTKNPAKGKLEVHHIESEADRPDLVFVASNCVTLCQKCHVSSHVRKLDQQIKLGT